MAIITGAPLRGMQGRDQISIADLLIVSELEQLRMLDGAAEGPYMADLLAPHPVVQQYMSRVIEVRPWQRFT